jgi:penicillin-binding protein 1A
MSDKLAMWKRSLLRFTKRIKKNPLFYGTAWVLAALFFAGSLGFLALMGLFVYYGRALPTVDSLKNYRPLQTTRVLDRKGRLIAEIFEERRTVVPMSKVPRVLVLSVLAAEDADFYQHQGLDYAGIARSLFFDLLHGKAMQGASTITQQIVKNVLLTPERTVSRKVRELLLARRLEQQLDKNQILYLYLNHINFGHGRYGVQEASRFYFDKDVSELNLAEASLLAGIPQSPSRFSPITHPIAAHKRQQFVLSQLEKKRDQYWDDIPLREIKAARENLVKTTKRQPPIDPAPEAVILARNLLKKQVGEANFARGGYTVETTIDLDIQALARKTLREGLIQIDKRQGLQVPLRKSRATKAVAPVKALQLGRTYDALVTGADDSQGIITLKIGGYPATALVSELGRFNPRSLPASQVAVPGTVLRASLQSLASGDKIAEAKLELGPQGAAIVLDPRTRDILALVGDEKAVFGFDRASNALRQPGSAFKPIVYALALDSGRFTPATLVLDAPEVYDQWKPDNYETFHYEGAVRLRDALAKSINLVAIRVINDLTPAEAARFARQLGITSPLDPSLALALGASAVRPIELVNAYATFASGGTWAPPRLVARIIDDRGSPVELPEVEPPRAVMRPAAAYLVTSLLTSVIRDGTGRQALQLKRPIAGKTGTSNDARDAWFVGYTVDTVAGVWVGYDDYRPLGKGESGPKSALPIWTSLMASLSKGKPVVDFPVPSGVVTAQIDPKSGLLAYPGITDAIEEVFLEGTVPTETSRPPDVLDPSSFLMEQLGGNDPPAPSSPQAQNTGARESIKLNVTVRGSDQRSQ